MPRTWVGCPSLASASSTGGLIPPGLCQRQVLEIERSEANEWQINILTNDFPALSAHRLSSMIRRSSVELGRGVGKIPAGLLNIRRHLIEVLKFTKVISNL